MEIHNQRYICEDPFWPSVHPRPHSPPYPKGGISYCGENTVAGGNRGDHFSVPCSNSIWRGHSSIFWPENHLRKKSKTVMVMMRMMTDDHDHDHDVDDDDDDDDERKMRIPQLSAPLADDVVTCGQRD